MRRFKYVLNDDVEEHDKSSQQVLKLDTNDIKPPSAIRTIENTIFFYSDVDTDTIADLNRTLIETDIKLQNTKNVLGEDYKPVIHLKIQSYGGGLLEAFSTVDTMRRLKSDVHTYVEGQAASAGTIISISGKKRFMGKYSFMLIHQLSAFLGGKFEEMEDQHQNNKLLMSVIKDIYKEKTKIPMSKLNEILKHDIWLSSKQCLEYGLVDHII